MVLKQELKTGQDLCVAKRTNITTCTAFGLIFIDIVAVIEQQVCDGFDYVLITY